MSPLYEQVIGNPCLVCDVNGKLSTLTEVSHATERHYSVGEIAEVWNLSPDKIRRLFQNEPGVVALGDPQPRFRRRPYTTLRIPESVMQRVHRRLSNS